MQTEQTNPTGTICTVLVDDSPGFLQALNRLLDRAPQIVVEATALTGPDALMVVEQSHPDLVLIDVALPGLNGIEVTRRLKQIANPPRIIVITISSDAAYATAAHQAGADGFLAKSACRTELIPLIQSLFVESRS